MSNEVLDRIKSQGYWQVVIRPERFLKERISTLRECEELLIKNEVKYRGWYFPHASRRDMNRRLDYIELAVSFMDINEAWRFYQSGLFVLFRGFREDWNESVKKPPIIKPGAGLAILSTLYQLSEMYEFAGRLAQEGTFDNKVFLKVNLIGTEGRKLFFWPGEGPRFLRADYTCDEPLLPREKTFKVTDLIARSREHSLEHFLWLMERFGFDASPDVFQGDQEKFFEGRY